MQCLKLPAYLEDSGAKLRIDGIVPVDAAPRGGFSADAGDGRLRKGVRFPPTLFVVMQVGGRLGAAGVWLGWEAPA